MEIRVIVGLVVLGLLFIATLYLLNLEKSKRASYSLANLSFDGLCIALIAILSFVPQIGYITIVPGLSLTLVHLPVLFGAMVGGRRRGLLLGTAFGLTSLIQAISNPIGFNALFILPYISIPPRMIFGYLSGLTFELLGLNKSFFKNTIYMGIACFFLTLLHTALVFGDLYLFAFDAINGIMLSSGQLGEGFSIALGLIILIGAFGEAILASIIVPLIQGVLMKSAQHLYSKVSISRR